MSRPIPPSDKTRNWRAYNEALRQRGSPTILFDPDMAWVPPPTGKRGRQPQYSDPAIQTCPAMKALFGMALRASWRTTSIARSQKSRSAPPCQAATPRSAYLSQSPWDKFLWGKGRSELHGSCARKPIEVGKTVIRIRGRRTELRKAIGRDTLISSPVPSFVCKWRRGRDRDSTFSSWRYPLGQPPAAETPTAQSESRARRPVLGRRLRRYRPIGCPVANRRAQ